MCAEQRKITNVALTGKYHWPYVKGWLLFTVFLTLLIESFALGCLFIVQTANPELSITKYIVVSGLIAALVIVGLAARGTLWAHRIAGVHLRTESVFNEIAGGDHSVRLRYRTSDQMEDVENAFDLMMEHILEGKLSARAETESDDEDDDSAQARERRSWKNMQMTSKYHLSYMAVWLLISLALIMACYAQGLLFCYLAHYINPGEGMNLNLVFAGATLIAIALGVGVIWKGFQTAHRLAGVHIKLINTFHRIAAGEANVTLKFRAYDRLDNQEAAFGSMMDSLNRRREG